MPVAVDTYECEVDRFGGADGLVAAEHLCCADSAAVADLLELRRRRTLVLEELPITVRTVDVLFRRAGGHWAAVVGLVRRERGRGRSQERTTANGRLIYVPWSARDRHLTLVPRTCSTRYWLGYAWPPPGLPRRLRLSHARDV